MRDNTDSALSQHPQICTFQNESEDRFRFTPVKRASSTIPRLWDRKPSTSFLGRLSRPRKVWKRFRTSFNSMKAYQQMMAAADKQVEDELDTEINASRSAGLLRGVKRRCLKAGMEDGSGDRGRSFLETKWESEMGRRRRKLPINDTCLEDQMSGGHETGQQPATSVDVQDPDESVDIEINSSTTCPQDTSYPGTLHGASSEKFEGVSDIRPLDDPDSTCHATSNTITEEKVSDATDAAAETTIPMDNKKSETEKDTAPAEEIDSAEQESTLVRSALRSSLDGEDAELLNNFLSKAKAKREAKAAMAPQEDVEEETIEEAVPDFPTPRSRRVLEELDTNSPSPSPQKAQAASPCKADDHSGSPLRKETIKEDKKQTENDQQQPGSPTTRRSTRTRAPRNPPRTTTTIPLSLRRAKGTEFVFLQRTEAQELALATRKNTRQNKGDSVLPKYTLRALARKKESNERSPSPDGSSTSVHKKRDARKTVCWNDARLVEFEDGEEPQSAPSNPDPSDGSFSDGGNGNTQQSTSKGSEKEKRKTTGKSRNTRSQASVPTIATPQPAARRMRRVGNSSSSTITTKTPSPSPPLSKDVTTTTPDKKRKKLTPKSPSTALLGTPPSKKSVTTTSTTTTTTTSSKLPKARSSASASKTSSTGAKSKSIFKANAGSTPMPKRVR